MQELNVKKDLKDMIYNVRGKQVMLDSDLAILYGCKNGTKEINQAVKNNPHKFPERYCFRITEDELSFLVKRIDQKIETRGGRYKNPTVFTEQGVYMLATILKTKVAAEATIKIMDTFVKMRKVINDNKYILNRIIKIEDKNDFIENTVLEHETKIQELFDKFSRKEDFKNKLFFNGEVYDAYSLLVDIIGKADKDIIVVDNYVDKITLDILSKKKLNVTVLLITDKNKSKLTKTEVDKFNKEYPGLNIKHTNIFHDRFIILDNKKLYHLGASLKDLGNKVFSINKIEDSIYIKNLIERIEDICMK